ncbi:membrane-bound lytic murein transglycosylase MltF [Azonexus sp.]|uniref:membrane-bound lytic murein transglycosylase MltF n=1 Tax=Azonexus sp. TaxID=1872668 RepID=UPI0039E4DAB0
MIAQLIPGMRRLRAFCAILFIALLTTGCGDRVMPLPFPTPGKQELVVLIESGPLTHLNDAANPNNGLEHDLLEAFGAELGVPVRFIASPHQVFAQQLAQGGYHIAAGWLSPSANADHASSAPLFATRDLLVQDDASLPLTELSQLSGKTVHVLAGSRQAKTLHALAQRIPGLTVVELERSDALDLLDEVGDHKISYAAMDSRLEDLVTQYVPSLRSTLVLSEPAPIVWQLGVHPNPELRAKLDEFIERSRKDGSLNRLEERYFGHVRRLTPADIEKFQSAIERTLPRLRRFFQDAERQTGTDWRLIAALAWQESHWDPFATSYTNVRGMMMLTEETADRLKVSNRLDARESILGGARYLNILRDGLPPEIPEPDRTWLAIAGYNLGPGHLNAGRWIAKQLKADPNAWIDMRRILPLMAKPEYYSRLKSGRARGGEAVIMTENIRSFYDILMRHEAPLPSDPLAALEDTEKSLSLSPRDL